MLKIERVETQLLDIPTTRPHVLSMATLNKQTIVLLRVYFSDGVCGVGEATTIGGLNYSDESPEGIKLTIDTYIAPHLVNQSFISIAETKLRIEQNIVGNRFAKCAVETALLDAMGHRLGVPVSDLLGGRINDELPVAWVLASGDLKTDIAEAEQMINDKRHNFFKVKIGKRSVAEDVAHVAAIKKAIGDRGGVRVDVNQSWSRSQASQGAAMLAEAGIDLIEQPLDGSDIRGVAQLIHQADISIMVDEGLRGPKLAFDIAAANAADVFSIKISQSGGLYEAQQVATIAATASVALYGGTMLESPIGTIASAHLFSTFKQLEWGTELFAPLLFQEQFITEPLEYRDFHLRVPNQPGLGVTLDEDKVKFFSRN